VFKWLWNGEFSMKKCDGPETRCREGRLKLKGVKTSRHTLMQKGWGSIM
jgi:hypothetical protein